MTTLYEDSFGSIRFDPENNFLRLDWTSDTADMTVEDFKKTLILLADAVVERTTEGVLVNVREFRPEVAMQIDDWRSEHIVPKYNRWLNRFAWLAGEQPPELPGGGAPYQNSGEHYVNRWFRNETEAVAWALGSE